MALDARDEDALLTLAFSVHATPGAYAVLLGAGVSAPSGIPTAWGVLEDLTSRVAHLSGVTPDNSIEWYESLHDEPVAYETLLERLAPTPLERQRLLREFFEPSAADLDAGRKGPTAAHQAIARLVRAGSIQIVVTLNFDRLMEQALRAEGIEPTVVATPADVQGLAPLHTLDCCVIHLHGDYLNPTSMLNTTTELAQYDPSTLKLLHRIMEDYGLLIAGWSSNYDPALRDAIASHYPSRFTLAWMEPRTLSETATELRTLKKGLLLSTDADTGFGRLADAVESLQTRESRHPLTLPVAVETAKRELSGRQVAISLHDTVGGEFSRLHDHRDFHLPDHQSDAQYGGYDAVLGRIEEASKVACALVATLAYWGDDASDGWWIDELQRFSTQARGSGLVRLLTLPLVTGTALFYSAGVAAVAARRYDLLGRMLGLRRTNPSRGELEPLALALSADTAYREAAQRDTRLFRFLHPILNEALALGTESLDDAWQIFEILRLATATVNRPQFSELAVDFLQKDLALDAVEQNVTEAERTGVNVEEMRRERAQAHQERGRALGSIAQLVPAGRPHVLIADRRMSESYRSPVAERLLDDLKLEADKHPLVKTGLLGNAQLPATVVEAVSLALGRAGQDQAWSRVDDTFGIIPNEIWLDTGKTPDELT